MNFVQMRAFHAVATYGSFSAAAQALGVSQPAITVQIKALEKGIGVKLFHRKGNGVALTDHGSRLIAPVRSIAKTLEEIESSIAATRELQTGMLAVGICAPFIAMPVFRAFCARYPGIRLNTTLNNSETLVAAVLDHRLDLAVATLRAPHPDLFCLRLVTQSVQVLVPIAHAWAKRPAIPVAALAGQRFVMRERGSMTRAVFEEGLREAGVAIEPAIAFGSREAMKEAVAAGMGFGIVLDKEVGHDPRLRALPVDGVDLSAGEYLFCLPDLADLGAIRAFVAAAGEVFEGDASA